MGETEFTRSRFGVASCAYPEAGFYLHVSDRDGPVCEPPGGDNVLVHVIWWDYLGDDNGLWRISTGSDR